VFHASGRAGAAARDGETGADLRDLIGIDLGIMLLMAENYRTGFVWNVFMDAADVRLGISLAGSQSHAPQPQIQLAAAD
jgi:hypothetical protein